MCTLLAWDTPLRTGPSPPTLMSDNKPERTPSTQVTVGPTRNERSTTHVNTKLTALLLDPTNVIAYTDTSLNHAGVTAAAVPCHEADPVVHAAVYSAPSSPDLAEARAVLPTLQTHEEHAKKEAPLHGGALTTYTDLHNTRTQEPPSHVQPHSSRTSSRRHCA